MKVMKRMKTMKEAGRVSSWPSMVFMFFMN
jgi:hypothetical protein